MNGTRRRGACPSLSAPMMTGDGWLVRLNPADGALSPRQLGEITKAAALFGNGILEITARGSLQIRGLTTRSAPRLARLVDGLGIAFRTGVAVDAGPLPGLDESEIADPRPLVEDIRARAAALCLAGRLGPKVSVTVDGGGALHLGEIIADVKLEALATDAGWLVRIGGDAANARVLGRCGAAQAVETTIAILSRLAAIGPRARARDLSGTDIAPFATALHPAEPPAWRPPVPPVGLLAVAGGRRARGACLPFGQIGSDNLLAFAQAAITADEIRLARGRGLLVLGLSPEGDDALLAEARRQGFVTEADDPRLGIVACAGSPACSAAQLATKALAEEIAAIATVYLDGCFRLHISGCEKRCAQPSGPSVTLVGRPSDCDVSTSGVTASVALRNALLRRGRQHLVVAAGRER